VDPYFPIGQAALSLFAEEGKVRIVLKTLTPNFERYEVQIDGGGWNVSDGTFMWTMHDGQNRVEARTVNKFGIIGPVSTAVLEIRR
jgi:hypothetical protein